MTAVIPTGSGPRAPSDCNSAPAQIYDEAMPPSESTRQAQASVERPSNGAGGATGPKPDACERCKKKYTADGHVKPVHWARRSQAWLCLWCVFEMPDAEAK